MMERLKEMFLMSSEEWDRLTPKERAWWEANMELLAARKTQQKIGSK